MFVPNFDSDDHPQASVNVHTRVVSAKVQNAYLARHGKVLFQPDNAGHLKLGYRADNLLEVLMASFFLGFVTIFF